MNLTQQAIFVNQDEILSSQGVTRLAVFNENGTPRELGTAGQAEAQADSVAVTVEALVIDFNALLAALRDSGALAS